MVDVPFLLACGILPTQARQFAPFLGPAFDQFSIRTTLQKSAFLAHAIFESQNFTHLEENLYYKTPERIALVFDHVAHLGLGALAAYCRNGEALGNLVYANINGNGDASSGDGFRYRGRGLFQLTGRANFLAAGAAANRPYKDQPDLVAQPEAAVMTAGWFWAANGCNEFALQGQFDKTIRRINPAMEGAQQRRALYATVQEAFSHATA